MTKTQIGFLIFFMFVILASALVLDYYKESYKILPLQEEKSLGVVPPSDVFSDWFDFKSLQGNFHVFLPVLPQNAKEKVTDPKTKEIRKYDMYIAEKLDGTIFMISMITLPKVPSGKEGVVYLRAIVDDMVLGNEQNVLSSSKEDTFKGYPSLDFTIDNKELTIRGLVFLKGDIIGVLTRISKLNKKNNDEFIFFTNSFNFNTTESN